MTSHAYGQTLKQRLWNVHEIASNEIALASERRKKKYDHSVNVYLSVR